MKLAFLIGCGGLPQLVMGMLLPASQPDLSDGRPDLQLRLHRVSACIGKPNCEDAMNDTKNFSDTMEEHVIENQNRTQEELNNFTFEFAACSDMLSDKDTFLKSFNEKVKDHNSCRDKQAASKKYLDGCTKLETSQQKIKLSACESSILEQPVNDMAKICEPSVGQPLGQWYESMQETFTAKYNEWNEQNTKCTAATWALGNTSLDCEQKKVDLVNQTSTCDADLDAIEAVSCSRAGNLGGQCSSYQQCYAAVKQRYDTKVLDSKKSVGKWKEIWIAAEKMKCMTGAVDGSNVDTDKMKDCNNASLVDTSHIKLTIPSLPTENACPVPMVYPGSDEYKSLVYGDLPKEADVRQPVACLAWKGGCYAYSTFGGEPVYLKYRGKYCQVAGSGEMLCKGQKSKFRFKHQLQHQTPNCEAGKLVDISRDTACRYAFEAADVALKCTNGKIKGNPSPDMAIVSNPLASGNSGEVTLHFPIPNIGSYLYAGSKLHWVYYHYAEVIDCNSGGVNGFHTEYDSGFQDRKFIAECRRDASSTWQYSGYRTTYTGHRSTWKLSCPTNQVISHIETKWVKSDRYYKIRCSKIPSDYTSSRGPLVKSPYNRRYKGQCGANAMLHSIWSTFLGNTVIDRQYGIGCTSLTPKQHSDWKMDVELAI